MLQRSSGSQRLHCIGGWMGENPEAMRKNQHSNWHHRRKRRWHHGSVPQQPPVIQFSMILSAKWLKNLFSTIPNEIVPQLGSSWVPSFLRCHCHLKIKMTRAIETARIRNVTKERVLHLMMNFIVSLGSTMSVWTTFSTWMKRVSTSCILD